MIAVTIGMSYLLKPVKTKAEQIANISKYFGFSILETIPKIIINTYIIREQKKASRIADMKAIEELNDYRLFK